jgi:LysM repeat protein
MSIQRKKFELSPALRLGVGRGHSNKILKISAIFCLILAAGLTVNALHLIFQGNSEPANGSAPQVLGATDIKTATEPQQQPQIVEYKITNGDTLFNISQKFNLSWATIATLNNLKSPFALKPGQVLKIPQ